MINPSVALPLQAIGFVTVCIVVMILIGLFVLWLLNTAKAMKEQREDRIIERTRIGLQSQLRSDGWWFSEDDATMNLIHGLASGERADTLREKWRAARKETKEAKSPLDVK